MVQLPFIARKTAQGPVATRTSVGAGPGARWIPLRITSLFTFFCLVLVCIQGWQELVARQEQVKTTNTALINLASSLTQYIDDTFDIADLVLVNTLARLRTDGTSPQAVTRLESLFAEDGRSSTRPLHFVVFDEAGNQIMTSLAVRGSDHRDRDYFRHHRDSPDPSPYIGPPVTGLSDGALHMTMSRRLDRPDGTFSGVVVAVINLDEISRHFATFDLGAGGAIALYSTKAQLLARYPVVERNGGAGIRMPILMERLAESPAGNYLAKATIDHVPRFVGYRRSARFPVVTVAAMAAATALADWRAGVIVHFTSVGALILVVALLGLGLLRRMWRSEAARDVQTREQNKSRAELERLARHLVKAREQADQASRAKSRFLAGMSHELRTPLNGILGYAQLLQLDGELSPKQAARVESMLEAGAHLLQIINCVLDLTEIEAERFELHNAKCNIRKLAGACLDFIRPSAEAKSLALCLTVTPEVPAQIMVDATRLRQVLLNLLSNAIKFTSEGSVDLRLSAVSGGAWLRLEVVDTGPGIPPERRLELFKDFKRLNIGADSAVEGAGLGLAISARLATLMSGGLGYAANLKGGSAFWLLLPLMAEADDAPMPSVLTEFAGAGTPAAPQPACMTILVVDDVAMNRDIAASFLRAAGHKVECAASGSEAVSAVQASVFDIVLMDVRMPGVDGLQATKLIRALDGPSGRVPIVAMTAQVFGEQIEGCLKAGMDGHLAKPFTQASLLEALASTWAAVSSRGAREVNPCLDPAASEQAIFDPAAFEQTTAYLSHEMILAHLQSLGAQGESILWELRAAKAPDETDELADAVHSLAGAAGLLGFGQLSSIAKGYEHILRTKTRAESAQFRRDLESAIGVALEKVRERTSAGDQRVASEQ